MLLVSRVHRNGIFSEWMRNSTRSAGDRWMWMRRPLVWSQATKAMPLASTVMGVCGAHRSSSSEMHLSVLPMGITACHDRLSSLVRSSTRARVPSAIAGAGATAVAVMAAVIAARRTAVATLAVEGEDGLVDLVGRFTGATAGDRLFVDLVTRGRTNPSRLLSVVWCMVVVTGEGCGVVSSPWGPGP